MVHDSHSVHIQPMDEKRDQMRGQRSTGVQHGDGVVRIGERGNFFLLRFPSLSSSVVLDNVLNRSHRPRDWRYWSGLDVKRDAIARAVFMREGERSSVAHSGAITSKFRSFFFFFFVPSKF